MVISSSDVLLSYPLEIRHMAGWTIPKLNGIFFFNGPFSSQPCLMTLEGNPISPIPGRHVISQLPHRCEDPGTVELRRRQSLELRALPGSRGWRWGGRGYFDSGKIAFGVIKHGWQWKIPCEKYRFITTKMIYPWRKMDH